MNDLPATVAEERSHEIDSFSQDDEPFRRLVMAAAGCRHAYDQQTVG